VGSNDGDDMPNSRADAISFAITFTLLLLVNVLVYGGFGI
jgi:hypothetical protein